MMKYLLSLLVLFLCLAEMTQANPTDLDNANAQYSSTDVSQLSNI
jgi:hypothetical protein